jgi:hypothetical protein
MMADRQQQPACDPENSKINMWNFPGLPTDASGQVLYTCNALHDALQAVKHAMHAALW